MTNEQSNDYTASLNDMAELYYSQGRYAEAEPLLTEALEMRKQLLGSAHPHVATSLNNLAYFTTPKDDTPSAQRARSA